MASSLSFLHQPISENPFPSTIVSSSSISSHIGLSIGLPGVTSLVFPLRVSRGSSGKVRASEISNQTQDSTNLRSVDLQMTEVPLLSSSEVTLKMKSRHVAGTFTKKKKSVVLEVCKDIPARPGRHLLEGGEHRRYFGLKTVARGVIEFECSGQREYDMWTQGVSRLLSIAEERRR